MISFSLSDEDSAIRDLAHNFAEKEIRPIISDREWLQDPTKRIPWEVVEEGSKLGFRTMTVPTEFGGLDCSLSTLILVLEELSWGDLGVAIIFEQTLKTVRRIARLGSIEQKSDLFPSFMKNNRYVMSGAVTEPAHGSDKILAPARVRLETRATQNADEWILNGTKHFITNGSEALLFLVTATKEPVEDDNWWTILMVPRETEGLEISRIHEKIAQRLSNNAEISFTDCRIPLKNELGTSDSRRLESPRFWMESNIEAAAMMMGTARAALESALYFARERIQSGKRIIEHQAVGLMFAEMKTMIESTNALILRAAWETEQPRPEYKLGSMAKYQAAESSFTVCRKAVEVMGGSGIMMEHPAQKYLRDSLSAFHFDGTQQITLLRIMNSLIDNS